MAFTYYRTQHNLIAGVGFGLTFGVAAHIGILPWLLCWVLLYAICAWLLVVELIVRFAKERDE